MTDEHIYLNHPSALSWLLDSSPFEYFGAPPLIQPLLFENSQSFIAFWIQILYLPSRIRTPKRQRPTKFHHATLLGSRLLKTMAISEQANAAVAEQPTGSAQYIEYADTNDNAFHVDVGPQQEADAEQQDYVGPWPLRRRSISSWTALSSETGATRGSSLDRMGDSAAINSSTNPFVAVFALENPFSDTFRSEASSSTAVPGTVEAMHSLSPAAKSELTLTLEQVDRQTEAIERILNRQATSPRNHGEARWNFRIQMDGGEEPANDSTDSEGRGQRPVAQILRHPPHQQPTSDIEREAAVATLSQLEAEDCRACKDQASVAATGRCLLGLTAGILGASPYLVYYVFSEELTQATAMMKEKQRTLSFLSLLAIPVTSALSLVFLAWLGLNSLGSLRRRLTGGAEYFKLWLCFTFLTVCSYFLIATVAYKYAK
ncbi:hypothetical protein CLAIMM_05779 [Cladophialophora immunda]|nr:hypothetical protein CLAIMM_05779 [Cladophialophora immunda]